MFNISTGSRQVYIETMKLECKRNTPLIMKCVDLYADEESVCSWINHYAAITAIT